MSLDVRSATLSERGRAGISDLLTEARLRRHAAQLRSDAIDFDAQTATMPAPTHEDAPGEAAGPFSIGEAVHLRGCPFGKPGRVLRIERGKLAILWADLGPSYIGRHAPASLMLAKGGL
jgi:hypothetical protein